MVIRGQVSVKRPFRMVYQGSGFGSLSLNAFSWYSWFLLAIVVLFYN